MNDPYWIGADAARYVADGQWACGENGWDVQVDSADFEPCDALHPTLNYQCKARQGHEHPHVACLMSWDAWKYQRVIAVRRKVAKVDA